MRAPVRQRRRSPSSTHRLAPHAALPQAQARRLRTLGAARCDVPARAEYAQAWERISERLPERAACGLMVNLLDLADRANVVVELAGVLSALHERGELPDIDALRARFVPRAALMPQVEVILPSAKEYDELLEAA